MSQVDELGRLGLLFCVAVCIFSYRHEPDVRASGEVLRLAKSFV